MILQREDHWPTDEDLINRAVKNARPNYGNGPAPRWGAVMDVFAVGSTVARYLCERAGVDPDEKLSPGGRVIRK